VKRTRNLMLAAVLGAGLTLAACGSDDSGDNGDGGTETKGKIGVILPDTKSSVRWESADRPALQAAFDAAGVESSIQNAEGDADKMATIADSMIADGVTVLAIVNLDSDSGAAIQEKAAKQGVKTIDYDRLTLGGSADVYISFDNVKVGELQGQGLADCRVRAWPTASATRRRTSRSSTARRRTTTRRCSLRARTAFSTR